MVGAEDTFALVLRHADPSRTRQRIVRQGDLFKSNYLGWLAHENAHGANVYFSVNSLLSRREKRTKNSIAEPRALYLDLDEDGDRKLAAIRASANVPPPTFVIRNIAGKCQVLWRVVGFSISEQEAMLKTLASAFGGDRACTDCARVLRMPGFFKSQVCSGLPRHSGERGHSHCLLHGRFQAGDAVTNPGSLQQPLCGSATEKRHAIGERLGVGKWSSLRLEFPPIR